MLQVKPYYSTGPVVDEVVTDAVMPSRADVVVVGGGIAGVTTAMFLAERGLSVILCEKGYLAAEQSSRNWGWVRVMGRDPREIPLMIEAKVIWEKYNAQLGGRLGLRQCGIIYLCENERELARVAAARLRAPSPHECEVLPRGGEQSSCGEFAVRR